MKHLRDKLEFVGILVAASLMAYLVMISPGKEKTVQSEDPYQIIPPRSGTLVEERYRE